MRALAYGSRRAELFMLRRSQEPPLSSPAKTDALADTLSKAPPAILMFWVVKICATTVGETGGDALSMSLNLGYLTATLIFLGFFLVTMTAQVASKR
jgi:uncharacterized membrane-anchored protein